jgi:hypothetical protein
MEVLGANESIASLKYVIDNSKNIIVIFDSGVEENKLRSELETLLNNENILFYFMFNKYDIVLSYIPESINNLIFKPTSDILKIQIDKNINEISKDHNLDDLLDKIEKNGIDSLTPDEKRFLDNFEK